MADPPGKGSKRERLLRPLQSGYDKLRKLGRSPSRSPSPLPGSSLPPSAGDNSASPIFTGTPDPRVTGNTVKEHGTNAPGKETGSTKPQARAALNADHVVPETESGLDQTGGAGSVIFSGLGAALQILAKSAGAFPPLNQALSGLIGCLDIVQSVTEREEEYEQLTSELTTLANTLSQYITELGPKDSAGAVDRIARSVEAEVVHINQRRNRSMGRRIVETVQDKEDVIKCYRKIEALFRELQSDINLRTWRNTNKLPLQYAMSLLTGMEPVSDATYNSSYSTTIKRRGCTADTRQKVQADIRDWIRDPDGAKVHWMNGMAGTGKTTIAYSVCEWLETQKLLGASFFCSRVSPSCRNVNLIVPTIAYQLALASPTFQLELCMVLEAKPGISKLNVVQQFENLIRQPLKTNRGRLHQCLVIVIDALDECDDDYGVQLILGILLKLAADLPLKFLITSRPEPAIQERILSQAGYAPAVLHLHDIEQSVVEADIKKYLTESLGTMSPPPSTEQIEQLVALAGKLFIYAATAVLYITSIRGYAMARLHSVLLMGPQSSVIKSSRNRYKALDELYAEVLSSAFDHRKFEAEEMEATQMVLWTVVCAKEPMTVLALALFTNLDEEQVRAALDPLQSVLHVPGDRKLVSTLHASFPDYMLDQTRSENFACDHRKHNRLLANRCFDIMREQLRFNICGLESSFTFDKDVPDIEQKVKSSISLELFYACQHWGDHLRLAETLLAGELCEKLMEFLDVRLLLWMEVMNLKQCVAQGISVLAHAEAWLMTINANAHSGKRTADARDFVTRFAVCPCSRSTPHIYLSALPFCARANSVYQQHWKRAKCLINIGGTAVGQRDRAAQATWKTDSAIYSVAFSHDGTRIVSGSNHEKVLVRDIHTGNAVAGPFEGHASAVSSVMFSPNDECVVSGSVDKTILVWNARTGDVVAGPFKGHTGGVNSVAFSPDGTCVASGSDDRTARVWDAHTGNIVTGPLEGHTRPINSVAFSPDGTRIVSGSADRTIRVWDARTGACTAGPFQGHTGSVNSVTFSPDSTRVVSGSSDNTVLVWNTQTSDVAAGPFKGHTDGVLSVGFCHDGARLVSGSADGTIRIWNSQTGDTIAGPFIGHTGTVNSIACSPNASHIVSGSMDRTIRVWDSCANNTGTSEYEPIQASRHHFIDTIAFSPDGRQIASGSWDQTIRVWDARTGIVVAGPFNGHTQTVRSVAFSPDGAYIVSASRDRTIRIWNASTGDVAAGPFEGHTDRIHSVAFSPDGAFVVSGSQDSTIRVWDARTGAIAAGPFQGHTDSVNSVAFAPDGTHIVSGSSDETIQVWDMHTGKVTAGPFKGHTGVVISVAFSPDGTRIASGSMDQTIIIWDAHTGDVVASPFKGHTGPVVSVAFSPNGTHLVSGSSDRTVLVWEAGTGRVIAGPFTGHTREVFSVAFSPDGMCVASGSQDKTIRVSRIHPPLNLDLYHQLLHHNMTPHPGTHDAVEAGLSSEVDPGDPPSHTNTPASNAPQATEMMDFKCHDDGWVTSNGIPLFWTPPDLQGVVPHPQDRIVMGYPGSLSIDYERALFGKRWIECYNPV